MNKDKDEKFQISKNYVLASASVLVNLLKYVDVMNALELNELQKDAYKFYERICHFQYIIERKAEDLK